MNIRSVLSSVAVLVVLPLAACQSGNQSATASAEPTTKTPAPPPSAHAKKGPGRKGRGRKGPRPKADSSLAAVGSMAPDFELPQLDGTKVKLSSLKGKVVVLEWFNPECPFVNAAHNIGSLQTMAKTVTSKDKNVVWYAINSNGPGKQGHGPELNQKGKAKFKLEHPILLDADSTVGKQYGATRTPEIVVIDKDGKIAYRGAVDDTGSGDPEDAKTPNKPVNHVQNALDDLAAGRPVKTPTSKPWGCSTKFAQG